VKSSSENNQKKDLVNRQVADGRWITILWLQTHVVPWP